MNLIYTELIDDKDTRLTLIWVCKHWHEPDCMYVYATLAVSLCTGCQYEKHTDLPTLKTTLSRTFTRCLPQRHNLLMSTCGWFSELDNQSLTVMRFQQLIYLTACEQIPTKGLPQRPLFVFSKLLVSRVTRSHYMSWYDKWVPLEMFLCDTALCL